MKLAAFVLGAIPLLIQLYTDQFQEDDKVSTLAELKNDLNLPRIKTYDFIVVGAGTAGCIVASRLSEQFSVLLLEEGGEPVSAFAVPYFTKWVGYDPAINFNYSSIPQRFASLDTGGVIISPTGRMYGGTSSHNDMVFNRGSPKDYDNYARILNDPSWRYENVVKFFKRVETFIGALFTGDHVENYGHQGPITVDTDTPPFLPIWFKAGKELGYNVGDPNAFQRESFTTVAKAIKKGQRSNAHKEYLKPILKTRPTLTVLPYSVAIEILIEENNRANGVLYERHGIPQITHASKEVIISSGSYGSPILLMKSGVGPRNQLEEAGIPVKLDLPVGQNLGDHLMFIIDNINYNNLITPFIPRMPQEQDFERMIQTYQETGEGILGMMQYGPQAFISSSRAKREGQGDWPDIQLFYVPMCHAAEGNDLPTSCMAIFVGRPKFRGTLRLNTTAYKEGERSDNVKLAIIDFGIFEKGSGSDLDVMVEGVDVLFKVINTTTMQKFGAVYRGTPHPACGAKAFMSREYWRCAIMQMLHTSFHTVGTCSMGSVTDSKFRLNGISNLRVVDASVFPAVPNANTHAPTMMIGEKAVSDILQFWQHYGS
ncbi:unnamed protein product [Orchesella dallaii]|uniref:Glucose-methanol-choline oxidoreductase N-terminal domain-containing protein n=1 Tax=Orchesella dallaii TaxID=48710 RepID=A0ABP1RLU8_9HEXA